MIYDIVPVNKYTGNDSATQFDFDFYIENQSQLNVFHYKTDGLKTKLTYNVDYSIHEFKNKNGSYITFPLPSSTYSVLSENESLSLELTLPISQETDYNNSSLLNLEALEYSFDYVTRLVQILSRRLNSCIELNDYTSSDITSLIQQVENCASLANSAYEKIAQFGLDKATVTSAGIVQIGSGINVDSDGIISVSTDYPNKDLSNLSDDGNLRLQYAPFSINMGNVLSGKNATLSYTDSVIACSACSITTSDNRTLSDLSSRTFDVTDTSDGDYYIFKNYSDGLLSLVSSFTISNSEPISPSDGDFWLDSSTIPANLKYYDTSDWTIENNLVYIGNCTVSSGVVTAISNRYFNACPYRRDLVDSYYDSGSWYAIYSDNWCEQGGFCDRSGGEGATQISLLKEYKDTDYIVQVSFNNNISSYPTNNFFGAFLGGYNKTTSSFYTYAQPKNAQWGTAWTTCGYLA